jgi:hypothetical protein
MILEKELISMPVFRSFEEVAIVWSMWNGTNLYWNSIAGELYLVFVYGVDGSAGSFGLLCSDVANPLPSDGIVFDGTTVYGPDASTIEGLPFCELSSVDKRGGRSA